MDARESFASLLAEFSTASGLTAAPDEHGGVTLEIGDVIVNLQLLPESEQLLSWTTLGFLGRDANADLRMVHLMRLNDTPGETGGYVFSFDRSDDDRVLAHDIRPLAFFDTADRLAAWIEALVDLVEITRVKIDEAYPFVDDESLDPVFEEVT